MLGCRAQTFDSYTFSHACQHFVMPSSRARKPNLHLSLSPQQVNSSEVTPKSSGQPSPTFILTQEYTLAKQTNSYREIWTKIHSCEDIDSGQGVTDEEQEHLSQILNPSQECVQEALQHARPNALTRLVSDYFDHSESTFHFCRLLCNSVLCAQSLYRDLHNLLEVLPLDSDSNTLTQPQCDRAYDVFHQFDCCDNPFSRDSHLFNKTRQSFSQLNQQLHPRLGKSRSRVRLLRQATTCSAVCLIGAAVGVVISAAVIASHALVALVAGPLLPAFLPSKITKKERAHLALLEAAARGTNLQHDLDTIDRLVESLHAFVDNDKILIRFGLERGRDRHSIHEVAKRLQKNHHNLVSKLIELEEHICLFFTKINSARSLVLREIHMHLQQSRYS